MAREDQSNNSASLAVRYRPTRLEDIVGQRRAVATIRGMFKVGKPPPTIMIAGDSGCGKTTLARILAHYVNCEVFDRKKCVPCGSCSVCLKVKRAQSADLGLLEYPGVEELNMGDKRGIETAREIDQASMYEAFDCCNKVFVLDEVQSVTPQAQSALLKMLEEPPQNVFFILLTNEPEKILPAARARAFRIDVEPASDAEVISRLRQIADIEGMEELTEDVFAQIAVRTYGVVRNAIKMLEEFYYALQGLAGEDLSDADLVSAILGVDERKVRVAASTFLLGGIYRGSVVTALKCIAEWTRLARSDLKQHVDGVIKHHVQAIYLLVDPTNGLSELYDPMLAQWRKQLVDDRGTDSKIGSMTALMARNILEGLLEMRRQLYDQGEWRHEVAVAAVLRMIQVSNGQSQGRQLKPRSEPGKPLDVTHA